MGTRVINTSGPVRRAVGAEQLARLSDPIWYQKIPCWECDDWIEPDEPVTLLVIRVRMADITAWAHPGCARSEIRVLSQAQIDARRARVTSEAMDESDVVAVAIDWPSPDGQSARPTLLLSYASDVIILPAGGDPVNAYVAKALEDGCDIL